MHLVLRLLIKCHFITLDGGLLLVYYSKCYVDQDGGVYGSRVVSSEKTLQFFVCLIVFLLFYVLDVVSITVYDRHGSSVAQRKPDFEFLNPGALFTDTKETRETRHLSGPLDRGDATGKEGRELASSSD